MNGGKGKAMPSKHPLWSQEKEAGKDFVTGHTQVPDFCHLLFS